MEKVHLSPLDVWISIHSLCEEGSSAASSVAPEVRQMYSISTYALESKLLNLKDSQNVRESPLFQNLI